jgi:hypothetical protein
MSTTIPTEFTGTATLTPEKLETIKEWYRRDLGDSDKAETESEMIEYAVAAAVEESILKLLYDMPLEDETPDEAPVLEMIERLKQGGTIPKDAVLVRSEDIPWPPPSEREMIDRLDASNRLRRDVPRATESYLTVSLEKEKS